MMFKHYTQYVKETVGADFKLSLGQRLRLLFCKKISVVFIDKRLKKGGAKMDGKGEGG